MMTGQDDDQGDELVRGHEIRLSSMSDAEFDELLDEIRVGGEAAADAALAIRPCGCSPGWLCPQHGQQNRSRGWRWRSKGAA